MELIEKTTPHAKQQSNSYCNQIRDKSFNSFQEPLEHQIYLLLECKSSTWFTTIGVIWCKEVVVILKLVIITIIPPFPWSILFLVSYLKDIQIQQATGGIASRKKNKQGRLFKHGQVSPWHIFYTSFQIHRKMCIRFHASCSCSLLAIISCSIVMVGSSLTSIEKPARDLSSLKDDLLFPFEKQPASTQFFFIMKIQIKVFYKCSMSYKSSRPFYLLPNRLISIRAWSSQGTLTY